MSEGMVIVSTEALVEAAKQVREIAGIFQNASNNFNERLTKSAYPRPWADDQSGEAFASKYVPAEESTRKALKDVTEGFSNLADKFHAIAWSFDMTEQGNAH